MSSAPSDSPAPPPLPAMPPALPAVQVGYAPRPDPWTLARMRNAKINCITMFVLFSLAMSWLLVMFVSQLLQPAATFVLIPSLAMPACVVLPGGLFAILYLPFQGKLLKSLPTGYRLLGQIGGLGLMVLFLIEFLLVTAILSGAGVF